jgi:hypothetical protein
MLMSWMMPGEPQCRLLQLYAPAPLRARLAHVVRFFLDHIGHKSDAGSPYAKG